MNEGLSFSAGPEFILFIAGAAMSLLAAGFVTWLVWNIFKEEREANKDE